MVQVTCSRFTHTPEVGITGEDQGAAKRKFAKHHLNSALSTVHAYTSIPVQKEQQEKQFRLGK